jgi:hypothetical protein
MRNLPKLKDHEFFLFGDSFGYLIKFVGRVPVFILGAAINIIVIIVMFSWQPTLTTQPGTPST